MAYGKGIEEVLSIQETMEDINAKDPSTGNYAIPTEVVVQKYLKERVNPQLPTTSILAALDHRKWEQKQQAEAQGPQQSVLEETITEADMAMRPTMNPMMPQGIQQGQPRPMPRQMPGQMAGLQRPPMPRRVPPQQRMGTGIPMMAAAGGYVPNFADGGIIGYKDRGYVSPNRGGYNTSDFLSLAQEYNNKYYGQPGDRPAPTGRYSKVGEFFRNLTSPDTLEERSKKDIQKTLQLLADEELTLGYGAFDQITDTERAARDERLAELKAIKTDLLAQLNPESVTEKEEPGKVVTEVIKNKQEEVEKDLKNNNPEAVKKVKEQIAGDTGFSGMGPAEDTADFLNENAFDMTYGKDKVDQMSIEDFRERLTGEGSAFAKQQQTTQEFRDELNKRAEESIMTTDEVLLKLGLGLMASGATKGRELEALGKVGLNVNKEFDQREDKSFNIKDKAKMLDLNLNKAEIELEMAEERFGQNSKQFEEKTRQFNKALAQKEELFREGEVGKTERAEIAADAAVKAAQLKNTQAEMKAGIAAINEARFKAGVKMKELDNAIQFIRFNDKFKLGVSETYERDAKRYLDYMKEVYRNTPLDWKDDAELMDLDKKLNNPIENFES